MINTTAQRGAFKSPGVRLQSNVDAAAATIADATISTTAAATTGTAAAAAGLAIWTVIEECAPPQSHGSLWSTPTWMDGRFHTGLGPSYLNYKPNGKLDGRLALDHSSTARDRDCIPNEMLPKPGRVRRNQRKAQTKQRKSTTLLPSILWNKLQKEILMETSLHIRS